MRRPCSSCMAGMDLRPSTFQFLVEALRQSDSMPSRRTVARLAQHPEWLERPYRFSDYYGDLDALFAHRLTEEPCPAPSAAAWAPRSKPRS